VRRIGKYEVLGLLGRGGMGAVYKVRAPGVGRILALKLLAPAELVAAFVGPGECERRFLREARTMGEMRHPNLAAVYDFDRDERGRPFFTLDYCCASVGSLIGETYRVEAPSRVLPLDRAADIALQTLAGLSRLHAAGIAHRDVKPFNLLLADGGPAGETVKLIDFGLSRLRNEAAVAATGEKLGSPYYAAPEQEADPAAADARADLYAVAVTLYRMLLGRLPEPEAPAPSSLNPDLDAAWDAFLARGLDPDPGRRFASAPDMAAALRGLVAAWRENLAAACALSPEPAPAVAPTLATPLRSTPCRTGPGPARAFFPVDELARPLRFLDPARFHAPGDQGHALADPAAGSPLNLDEALADPATGLTWLRGGSDFALAWAEAPDWLAGLNAARFAGRADWRLPTAEELLTLLVPPRRGGDFCLAPRFDPAQDRLWSADRATYASAWFANAQLGFLDRMDASCLASVRAVAGPGDPA
jgi:serine/threonine-protein kinase